MTRPLRLLLVLLVALLAPYSPAFAQSRGETGDPITQPEGGSPSIIQPMFSGCTRVNVSPINAAWEQKVVELVNQHRIDPSPGHNHNLPPLKRLTDLDYAARYHAKDMADENYFEHDSYDRKPYGLEFACSIWDRLNLFISNRGWGGENIAAGQTDPVEVMKDWIDSPGHHSNMVNLNFTLIGVGYYSDYWVQDFISQYGVYPVVINREAAITTSKTVSLYIYGQDVRFDQDETHWDEMRLRNDTGHWSTWRTFQSNLSWDLPCNSGNHTVSVEMRKTGQATGATASDSIQLTTSTGGSITLGNVPPSITFMYGLSNQKFVRPSYTFKPANIASAQTATWTLTKSAELTWLGVSPMNGTTPNGSFTVTPGNTGGVLNQAGKHYGTLSINASSTDQQCPAIASATVSVQLIVVPSFGSTFLPVTQRKGLVQYQTTSVEA